MTKPDRPKSNDPRRTDPHRHILLNTVGITPGTTVDTAVGRVSSGDYILLCSDGLWEYVADAEFQQIVTTAPTPQNACDTLVALANERGGDDNISVVVVKVG